MKHPACKRDELEPGNMLPLFIDRTAVVLVRTLSGDFYALRDICPHRGARLSDGALDGSITWSEEVGEARLERDSEILRCPWHSWEFDVETGCSLIDPDKVRVRSYGVTVEEGTVFIHK